MILRLIPSALAGFAVLLALGASIRVPAYSMPWVIQAFLAAQFLADVLDFLNLYRAQNHEPEYVRSFAFTFAVALLLGIAVVVKLVRTAFPGMAWLSFGLVAALYSLAWGVAILRKSKLEDWALVVVGYSTLMLCCGTLCSWAAIADLQPALKVAAIVLGVRWQAQAAFGFAYSIGITRNFWLWFRLNHFMPQVITVICALWLCVWYSGLHSESAKPLWAETVRLEARP